MLSRRTNNTIDALIIACITPIKSFGRIFIGWRREAVLLNDNLVSDNKKEKDVNRRLYAQY